MLLHTDILFIIPALNYFNLVWEIGNWGRETGNYFCRRRADQQSLKDDYYPDSDQPFHLKSVIFYFYFLKIRKRCLRGNARSWEQATAASCIRWIGTESWTEHYQWTKKLKDLQTSRFQSSLTWVTRKLLGSWTPEENPLRNSFYFLSTAVATGSPPATWNSNTHQAKTQTRQNSHWKLSERKRGEEIKRKTSSRGELPRKKRARMI